MVWAGHVWVVSFLETGPKKVLTISSNRRENKSLFGSQHVNQSTSTIPFCVVKQISPARIFRLGCFFCDPPKPSSLWAYRADDSQLRDPNKKLSNKSQVSQSLGRDLSPPFPSPGPWLGKLLASWNPSLARSRPDSNGD